MNKLILFVLCMMCCINAFAQTITVKEVVTHTPIEGVLISTINGGTPTITDKNGQADITPFNGVSEITIVASGYKSLSTSYDVISAGKEILLEANPLSLDEVVVSATRWKQNATNVPQKISSVTKDEVVFQNPQTAADLLSLSGKVYTQKSQQAGGSPMIRGFATNRLLYSVDGVRMNTAIFRAGNIQNVINLDPFSIQKTEVFFGPGSVMYGSDAVGGVMNFQTLTPNFSFSDNMQIKGNVNGRFSSANKETTGHGDISFGWKNFAMTTSVSYWNFDHLRQGKNGPSAYLKNIHVERINNEDKVILQEDSLLQVPSAYSQINLMQKLRFAPNQNWDIQYGFHYSETDEYGRYDRHLRMRNGTARYAEWNYGPQKWMMNNLNITQKSNGGFYEQLIIRAAHQKFDESRIDRNLNNSNRNTQSEKVMAYSLNIDFLKTKGKSTWNYGVEYVLNDVTSTGVLTNIEDNSSEAGPSRYPQAQWQSYGVFINNNIKLSDKTNVQAGLRYSRYLLNATFNTTFFPLPYTEANMKNGSLTGSLGLVVRPTSSWVLSANIGTAFRAPNVDDMGKTFESAEGFVTVPNPGLKPEYAYSFDVGIAKVFNDVVKIDLSGYYTILNDALVTRAYTYQGSETVVFNNDTLNVEAIQNAAVANVYGLQAGIEIALTKNFSLSSDYNIQIGEEELDDASTSPSRHASPNYGVTRLTFAKNKLRLQVYAQYMSEKSFTDLPQEETAKTEIYAPDANGDPYAPAWYTLNFKGMYALNKNFSMTAGVENITDQRYRPYSSGISAAGLNFVVGVNASF